MSCRYCKWANGHHDPDCPDHPIVKPEQKQEKYRQWQDGVMTGSTSTYPDDMKEKDPSFQLGWRVGDERAQEQVMDPHFPPDD